MKVEHPIGFEPITRCLQGSRSTIELREQIAGIRGPAPHQEECQGNFVFYHTISIHCICILFLPCFCHLYSSVNPYRQRAYFISASSLSRYTSRSLSLNSWQSLCM